jgi:quinol monooxygenase YgiN
LPLLIAGTFRLPPENLDAARGVMAAMIEASRAEEGCEVYSYAQDVAEPGLIRVIEKWRDRASLTRHFDTAHLAAWRAAWPGLRISDRRLALYEIGEAEPI